MVADVIVFKMVHRRRVCTTIQPLFRMNWFSECTKCQGVHSQKFRTTIGRNLRCHRHRRLVLGNLVVHRIARRFRPVHRETLFTTIFDRTTSSWTPVRSIRLAKCNKLHKISRNSNNNLPIVRHRWHLRRRRLKIKWTEETICPFPVHICRRQVFHLLQRTHIRSWPNQNLQASSEIRRRLLFSLLLFHQQSPHRSHWPHKMCAPNAISVSVSLRLIFISMIQKRILFDFIASFYYFHRNDQRSRLPYAKSSQKWSAHRFESAKTRRETQVSCLQWKFPWTTSSDATHDCSSGQGQRRNWKRSCST